MKMGLNPMGGKGRRLAFRQGLAEFGLDSSSRPTRAGRATIPSRGHNSM